MSVWKRKRKYVLTGHYFKQGFQMEELKSVSFLVLVWPVNLGLDKFRSNC
jgi:hypothetical protein